MSINWRQHSPPCGSQRRGSKGFLLEVGLRSPLNIPCCPTGPPAERLRQCLRRRRGSPLTPRPRDFTQLQTASAPLLATRSFLNVPLDCPTVAPLSSLFGQAQCPRFPFPFL